MKRFLSLFLVALALIGCCSFAFIQPVAAADYGITPGFYVYSNSVARDSSVSIPGVVFYLTKLTFDQSLDFPYDFMGSYSGLVIGTNGSAVFTTEIASYYMGAATVGSPFSIPISSIIWFEPTSTLSSAQINAFNAAFTPIDSPFGSSNSPSDTSTDGIYPAIYDLISDAFYGDGAELTGDQTLVLTILATTAIVFMFAIPFLVVFLVIRLVVPR